MKKVYFKTFGCRTNLFDTQVMDENLKDFSATLEEQEADIIVINSCTVTNGAD
ncbi:tRNA (N(6)-L-threonylcarbamoyladenosine(37)-C(2))-methylthiotransferase MtaB, partial [Helicobacter pylori]